MKPSLKRSKFEGMIRTGEAPLKNDCLFLAFVATNFELFNVNHGVSATLIVNPIIFCFAITMMVCRTQNKKFDCRHKFSDYQVF
jgi:hypothetical protein